MAMMQYQVLSALHDVLKHDVDEAGAGQQARQSLVKTGKFRYGFSGSFSGLCPYSRDDIEIPPRQGSLGTSPVGRAEKDREHCMRYPEKLIDGGEGVALDSAKPSPRRCSLFSKRQLTVSLSIRL